MSDTSCGDGSGKIVTLGELRAKFKLISHGEYEWSAQLFRYSKAPDIGWLSLCVHFWDSNPELLDMPNQMCFRFLHFIKPLGHQADTGSGPYWARFCDHGGNTQEHMYGAP
jgi:hypothetical protein